MSAYDDWKLSSPPEYDEGESPDEDEPMPNAPILELGTTVKLANHSSPLGRIPLWETADNAIKYRQRDDIRFTLTDTLALIIDRTMLPSPIAYEVLTLTSPPERGWVCEVEEVEVT